MDWCGLLVDYYVFISRLDSHSDGTHSLSTFSANFQFWVNYSFRAQILAKSCQFKNQDIKFNVATKREKILHYIILNEAKTDRV